MPKIYNPASGATYNNFRQASEGEGILGLNESNCGEFGLVLPTDEPAPDLVPTQKATLADIPTENPDGSWSYKWSISDKTAAELAKDVATKKDAIRVERDRRLQADFTFNGQTFQRDTESLARITGAATLAGFAIAAGAQPGDLRWANPARDFGWIASDDTVVPMDAQTAFAFGQAAAEIETSIVFAAKTLREMDPIPDNITDDQWWP